MKAEIYPAILTHNIEEYSTKLELIENSDSRWAQIDIMDGQFVPNITVMPHEIMGIQTKINLEAHMMTYAPERYFSDLAVANIARVLLHREAFESLEKLKVGCKLASEYFNEVGIVINLDTRIEDYHELPINSIQFMGVPPGQSGQPLDEKVYANIRQVVEQKLNLVLAIDGGVNENNIKELQQAGISRFIISSHLFASNNLSQNVQYFIQLVQGGI